MTLDHLRVLEHVIASSRLRIDEDRPSSNLFEALHADLGASDNLAGASRSCKSHVDYQKRKATMKHHRLLIQAFAVVVLGWIALVTSSSPAKAQGSLCNEWHACMEACFGSCTCGVDYCDYNGCDSPPGVHHPVRRVCEDYT